MLAQADPEHPDDFSKQIVVDAYEHVSIKDLPPSILPKGSIPVVPRRSGSLPNGKAPHSAEVRLDPAGSDGLSVLGTSGAPASGEAGEDDAAEARADTATAGTHRRLRFQAPLRAASLPTDAPVAPAYTAQGLGETTSVIVGVTESMFVYGIFDRVLGMRKVPFCTRHILHTKSFVQVGKIFPVDRHTNQALWKKEP